MLDVKTTRAKTGLSQSDFAKRLGVSQAAVAYWEKGDKKPTQEQVENIRSIFPIEATTCAVDPLWVAMSAIFDQIPKERQRHFVDTLIRYFSPQ